MAGVSKHEFTNADGHLLRNERAAGGGSVESEFTDPM
jgi:hypothetical protein